MAKIQEVWSNYIRTLPPCDAGPGDQEGGRHTLGVSTGGAAGGEAARVTGARREVTVSKAGNMGGPASAEEELVAMGPTQFVAVVAGKKSR